MVGFARWLTTLAGGVLLGAGLFLHAEVALARYMRDEVDRTFFVWRAVGQATFLFQDDETRMALAMSKVPDEALRASERSAWMLVFVGGMVALTGPLLRRGRAPQKR
jgi:hypothetical protein